MVVCDVWLAPPEPFFLGGLIGCSNDTCEELQAKVTNEGTQEECTVVYQPSIQKPVMSWKICGRVVEIQRVEVDAIMLHAERSVWVRYGAYGKQYELKAGQVIYLARGDYRENEGLSI